MDKFIKRNEVDISSCEMNILIYICLLVFSLLCLVIVFYFFSFYLLTHIAVNLFDYNYV